MLFLIEDLYIGDGSQRRFSKVLLHILRATDGVIHQIAHNQIGTAENIIYASRKKI